MRSTEIGSASPNLQGRVCPVGSAWPPPAVRRLAANPGQHPGQRSFAEQLRPPAGDLEPSGGPLEDAGAFKGLLDLLQPAQIADRVLTQGAVEFLLVNVVERGSRVVAAERLDEVVVLRNALDGIDGVRHRHETLAPSRNLTIPGEIRGDLAQRLRQLIHLKGQVEIVQHRGGELSELCALFRGHACEQAAHGGHPAGHRLEELLEVPGLLRPQVPVSLHERIEVVCVASPVGSDHFVQLGQHVLDAFQIAGLQIAHRAGELVEVGVQDFRLQFLEELLEAPARLIGDERVVLHRLELLHGRRGESVQFEVLLETLMPLVIQCAAFQALDVRQLFAQSCERAGRVEFLGCAPASFA